MYMHVVSAEYKYPIYHFYIIIKYHDTLILILDYCSHFTQIASALFKCIPNQVWSYIHELIKTIVGFSFWY